MNKYAWLLFAALCGALVSLQVEKKARTPIQKATFVFCGLVFSFFVTPLITSHWHLEEPGQISAIGFLIALGWQNLYNRFTRGIDEINVPFTHPEVGGEGMSERNQDEGENQ